MSNLIKHAEAELKAAGFHDDKLYDGMLYDAVLELVTVFSKQGHSGMSAGIALDAFKRVAAFEPLGPLTGKADEWVEVSYGLWQNKRCSHVFKEKDGRAYDIEGKIFREPDGQCFINRDSRVYVEFPYIPRREYVDRPAALEGDGEQK